MTSTVAPQTNLRLNFNDREYDFSELPRNAQFLLQDMMRIDQQINQLQFELRHLQTARRVYYSSFGKAMSEELQTDEHAHEHEHEGGDGSFEGN